MRRETILTTFEDWTLRFHPPQTRPAHVLLLLHGWTGDEDSMWVFVRHFPSDCWMIAPRAPYVSPLGGYSWRMASRSGEKRGWPTFEEIRPSAAMLLDFIERWGIANAVDTSRIDLMGFSQGGAMAVTFALSYPQRVRRVGMLAGFAPDGTDRFIAGQPLKSIPLFVTHGTQDETVSIDKARRSMEWLAQAGAEITYCEADVGHKVSAECLRALETFFLG